MKTDRIYLNRWLWIGMLAAAATCYAPLSSASPATDESCRGFLPPGAPGFAEAQERLRDEARKNGYVRVCDVNLGPFNRVFQAMAKSFDEVAFAPVELAGTPFEEFESVGGMAEKLNGVKSILHRGFESSDGRKLILFEHDMSADGTSAYRNPEDEPERVNGIPARLYVRQGTSGAAVSNLSWTEGRRSFALSIDANVAGSPLREKLFALASSLPKSIPACPNEIPPKKHVLGPDGTLQIEPMPAVLTEAEMNALVADINRRNNQAIRCSGGVGTPGPTGSRH